MQNLRILHKSSLGYIMHCPYCKGFYLGYGVIGLKMTKEEVLSFTNELERRLNQWKERIDPLEKSFFFSTPTEEVKIILCYKEMDQWYQMLANGLLLLEVEQVMEDDEYI